MKKTGTKIKLFLTSLALINHPLRPGQIIHRIFLRERGLRPK